MGKYLLPCPFCGGTNLELAHAADDKGDFDWEVTCSDCPGIYDTEAEAVAAWNRRVVQQLASHADLIASLTRSAALMQPFEPPYAEENGIWQRPVADSAVFQPYTGDPAEPLSTE